MKSISQSLATNTFSPLMHPLLLIFILINGSMKLHAAAGTPRNRQVTFCADTPATSALQKKKGKKHEPISAEQYAADRETAYQLRNWYAQKSERMFGGQFMQSPLLPEMAPQSAAPLSRALGLIITDWCGKTPESTGIRFKVVTNGTTLLNNFEMAFAKFALSKTNHLMVREKLDIDPTAYTHLQWWLPVKVLPALGKSFDDELRQRIEILDDKVLAEYNHEPVLAVPLIMLEERRLSRDGKSELFFPRTDDQNPGKFIRHRFCLSSEIDKAPFDENTIASQKNYICQYKYSEEQDGKLVRAGQIGSEIHA